MTTTSANINIGLLLHDVTDDFSSSGFQQPTAQRYKHSVAQFVQYLDDVELTGLPVVTPQAAHSVSGRPVVTFTFDDGGASAPVAAELLEERGWRGVFFVTTDLLNRPGFMSSLQVQNLRRRGHVIGSHSCSHPDVFRSLSRRQMAEEWIRSRDVLQQLLGEPIHTASIPGGDCSNATIEEASAAGLTQIFTSEQITHSWSQAGATCFGRMMMLDNTSRDTLNRWLTHPTVGILPERALRFTKSHIKKLMGPLYLQLVRQRRAMHEQG
ncbi:MAG: polysaccharide deacetylase family protein [Fuerstiella sp.]|nr:polysaccharide deacetylase family protein [Fuerstiella sp.]MDG2128399.1 polysaccharide deacetylase family protein [Fuerstiella sp.]